MIDQPKIEPWMPPEDISFRQGYPALIDKINQSQILPQPVIVNKIFMSGQSSIVALINAETNPQILKTAYESDIITNEALILKDWGQVVKTPQVLFVHPPDQTIPTAIFISEYISGPLLKETLVEERIESGISQQMGQTLAIIHSRSIPEQLTSITPVLADEISRLTNKRLVKLTASETINQHMTNTVCHALDIIHATPIKLVVNHGDFLPYNLFGSVGTELTVFDPNVTINHPVYDLANSLVSVIAETDPPFGKQEADHILKGYQDIAGPVDAQLLSAYKAICAIRKILKWQHKIRPQKVTRALELLDEIKL
jgi:hypothetical protein